MIRILIFLLLTGISFRSFPQLPYLDEWQYITVDDDKSKFGDYGGPEWLRYFGLDIGDANNDGMLDILSGRTVYINPGGAMEAAWLEVDLGQNVDGILFLDVDGDEFSDIIAQSLPDLFWIEAEDATGSSWKLHKIGEIPPTSHVNSQGFKKGQIIPGGPEEFLIAGDGNIYCFQIPTNPESKAWTRALIGANTSDEGIGVGDVDGDGDLDIATGRRPEGGAEPLIVTWFENPGILKENWTSIEVGTANHPVDRVEIGDVNGDKKADIIISEERYPGIEPDGNLFWFEQPQNANAAPWNRHRVVTQYSMNNLDIGDIDQDGDLDLVTNEHKGRII